MTTVRSFSFLIVSFHTFYKGMCILAYVLKEGKKKKKRKKERKEGKKKEKKVGGIKDCALPPKK